MSGSNSAAGARKAPAAGRSPAKKKFKFRGLAFEVPKDPPPTFAFDLAQIQAREQSGEDAEALGGVYLLLESMVGPEQLQKVRGTVKGMDDPWIGELLEALTAAYGTDSGKSPASAKS